MYLQNFKQCALKTSFLSLESLDRKNIEVYRYSSWVLIGSRRQLCPITICKEEYK